MTPWVAHSQAFHPFGPEHFVILGLFALGCVLVVVLGRRQHEDVARLRLCRGFAVLVAVIGAAKQIVLLLPGYFQIYSGLPLQLCYLSWVAAAWALWTRGRVPLALTYYWGLTLTTQAVLTPSLGQSFPDPRFFGYWASHVLTVWAAVYLTWGLREAPDWRSYRLACAATAGWAAVALVVNEILGTNYGYLNAKPHTSSVLDLLGPWPVSLVAEAALVLAGWAVITWPWVRLRRHA